MTKKKTEKKPDSLWRRVTGVLMIKEDAPSVEEIMVSLDDSTVSREEVVKILRGELITGNKDRAEECLLKSGEKKPKKKSVDAKPPSLRSAVLRTLQDEEVQSIDAAFIALHDATVTRGEVLEVIRREASGGNGRAGKLLEVEEREDAAGEDGSKGLDDAVEACLESLEPSVLVDDVVEAVVATYPPAVAPIDDAPIDDALAAPVRVLAIKHRAALERDVERIPQTRRILCTLTLAEADQRRLDSSGKGDRRDALQKEIVALNEQIKALKERVAALDKEAADLREVARLRTEWREVECFEVALPNHVRAEKKGWIVTVRADTLAPVEWSVIPDKARQGSLF